MTNHVSSCYWESLQWEKVEMHKIMWIILLKDAFQVFKSDSLSIDFLFKSYLDSIFSILDFTSLSKGLIKTIQVLMILICHNLVVQALTSCQTILPQSSPFYNKGNNNTYYFMDSILIKG